MNLSSLAPALLTYTNIQNPDQYDIVVNDFNLVEKLILDAYISISDGISFVVDNLYITPSDASMISFLYNLIFPFGCGLVVVYFLMELDRKSVV